MHTFKYIGTFQQASSAESIYTRIPIDKLHSGFNLIDHLVIRLDSRHNVCSVFSSVCDHAKGTLELNADGRTATCPLHGWTLDLETLKYTNVGIKKKSLPFEIKDNTVSIETGNYHLKFPQNQGLPTPARQQVSIRHLAHACLLFDFDGCRLITDPWLTGPCFSNGWWHHPAPAEDAMDCLLGADVVYISHNHADHMHLPTLQRLLQVRPNIPILVPAFKTQSAIRPLRGMGFKNVHALSFNQIYQMQDSALFVSILKSGDFRDDSGLYVRFGDFQGLITVDSSILNHLVLPKKLDFLATAFAGGASGYPWCFEYYSIEQRREISAKRRQAAIHSISEYLHETEPRSYMPYAGYFAELAPRDEFIRMHNQKNSLESIETFIAEQFPAIEYINPTKTDLIQFSDGTIDRLLSPGRSFASTRQTEVSKHLQTEVLPDQKTLDQLVHDYFSECRFQDGLLLYLQPTEADFSSHYCGYLVDFSLTPITIQLSITSKQLLEMYEKEFTRLRKLRIRVRAAALYDVLKYKKPWEELSIGFQCRILRDPDVYNSEFWYYFSNVYTDYMS